MNTDDNDICNDEYRDGVTSMTIRIPRVRKEYREEYIMGYEWRRGWDEYEEDWVTRMRMIAEEGKIAVTKLLRYVTNYFLK
jgi:hypothetical protein